MCCTRRRHATDRMCAFDTAASQHAADEDNRHATLARTQLTATKARTQGSVDIRRRHANRPRRDPRTARACQRALQSLDARARSLDREQKSAPRTKERQCYPVQGYRAIFMQHFKRLQHLCLCVRSVKIGHAIPGEVQQIQLAGYGLLAVKAASVS